MQWATFVFVFKKFEGEVFFLSGWQRGAEKSGAGAGIENWTSLHILTITSHVPLFSFSFLCISFIFRPPPPTFLLFLSFFWCIHFVFWPPHLPFFCFLDMCTDSGEWWPADEPRNQNTGTSIIIVIGIVFVIVSCKLREAVKNYLADFFRYGARGGGTPPLY